MELYDWQKESFDLWADNKFRGVIQAVTGAGKTTAACDCIRKYKMLEPDAVIWVVTDYNDLRAQWTEEPIIKQFDIKVMLYLSAVGEYDRLSRLGEVDKLPKLLVIDECHHLEAPKWGQIVEKDVKHVLGLSATPGEAYRRVGPILQKIGYDKANIAPSEVHLILFPLTDKQQNKYLSKTRAMENYLRESNPYATFYNDPNYMRMSVYRKAFLDALPQRMEIALEILKNNMGKRAIVFFSKSKQVMAFSEMLENAGLSYAIHISRRKEIEKFKDHTVNILLCINMVATGFSDPTIDLGIMVSYNQSKRDNIQRTGRVLRYREGKTAQVFYPVAIGTTDETIVKNRNSIFPDDSVRVEKWK